MNEKNECLNNRNIYSFNICKSLRESSVKKKNKKLNEGLDFRRTTSDCILNTDGKKPLILYFKSPKKISQVFQNRIFESQFNIINYISDGGLKQKKQKFLNLVSNYPLNINFHSPTKYKKEIKNSKNKKYNSLTYSNKKLSKNKTSSEYLNYNEEDPNLLYNTTRKKMKNNLFCEIKKNILKKNDLKKRIKNYMNNNNNYKKNVKMKKYYKLNMIKKLAKNMKVMNNLKKDKNSDLLLIERKKQILQRIGIDINKIDLSNIAKTEDILKKKENQKAEEEKKEEEKNNNGKNYIDNYKNIINEKNKYLKDHNEKVKIKKKPIIDQFEFINKILKAHKNLSPENKSKPNHSKTKMNNFLINVNNDETKEPQSNNENNNINITEETLDEFPYFHRKNHRAQDELKMFIKLKKIKEKNISKENELETRRKLYIRFQNLYKLNLENINSDRFSNHIKNNKIKNLKNPIKKKKEINKYYIGNEVSKNNSTFIEPNDYYIALYESKQVITNSNIDITSKFLDNLSSQYNIKKITNKQKNYNYSPKLVYKFVKIIRLIFAKKVLNVLYHRYNGIKHFYRNYLALNYLIAIIKQYPFNKIYSYYKNGYEIQATGNKIDVEKIIDFVQILSLFYKIKVFEKLFNYCQQVEIKVVKEQLEGVIKIMVKPHLKYVFDIFKYNNNINKDDNINDIDIKNNLKEIYNNKDNDNYLKDNEENALNEDIIININKNIENNNKIIKNEEYVEEIKNNNIEDIKEYNTNLINDNIKNRDESLKDISAERDHNQDISWEYNCSNDNIELKKGENENQIPNIQKDNEDDEYSGDFHDIKSNSESSDILIDNKTNNDKNKNDINDKQNQINNRNIDLIKKVAETNTSSNKCNEDNINNKNNENNNIIIEDKKGTDNSINDIKLNKINNPNKLSESLTEEIIKQILNTEIISPDIKLIPNKSFKKIDNNINTNEGIQSLFSELVNLDNDKDLNYMGIINQDSLLSDDSKISLNNSLIFSTSTYSIFNKTVKDKKVEKSINLYMDKIAPKLIKIIKKELIVKHKRIYDNLSTPFKNDSKNIIMALSLQDNKLFKDNYKQQIFKESLEDIIDKKNLLKKFDKINNDIRIKDNISSDNYYDKILNECIIDTVIELINKERIHFIKGEPLMWSDEKKEEINIYDIRNDPKKFSVHICKLLVHLLNTKLGRMSDKNNLINSEKINIQNENKLNNVMKEEIVELEKNWENLEIEETKAKLETADYIFEMILRENIEILEHVENNRKRPDLYEYKSIYACPAMPKLEFQKTENDIYYEDSENELINI